MSFFVMASFNSGVRSPALPIHVVQPYAARVKPSLSRYDSRLVFVRYSVTIRDPGASDVLMCGATVKPASTAFFASKPAASNTLGFEVFVHDVIAAIRMSPLLTLTWFVVTNCLSRSAAFLPKPLSLTAFENSSVKFDFTLPISMRSCGRFGPASDGATVPRSSVNVFV